MGTEDGDCLPVEVDPSTTRIGLGSLLQHGAMAAITGSDDLEAFLRGHDPRSGVLLGSRFVVAGLDVLQADAARAVAGTDRLVLVVGPAGTGTTTTLAAARTDLAHQRRLVFGVAPTAKAARVLVLRLTSPRRVHREMNQV